MPHVFISYARREPYWAAELDADLRARGYKTWRDTRDIDPDQDFTGEIEAGIRDASHMVACLTSDVQRTDSFVRRELQYALNFDAQLRERDPSAHLPVIPVMFPGGELPVHISTWTALFLGDRTRYKNLLEEIIDRLERPITPNEQPNYDDLPEVVSYLRELHNWCGEQLLRSTAHLLSIGTRTTHGMVEPGRESQFKVGFSVSPANVSNRTAAPETRTFSSLKQAMGYHGNRLMLLGAPGSGKTTTLLALARDATVARLPIPTLRLPVLGSIRSWDCTNDLKSWLMRSSPWPAREGERPIYLLDGLDELGGAREIEPGNPRMGMFDPRWRFLEFLARDLPTGSVVVTSRVRDYQEIGRRAPLDAAVTLTPLSDEQIRDYLLAQGQEILWERVGEDPEFADLVRTPLLLGMLSVAVGGDASEFSASDTPVDEGFIFDRYITRRFIHEVARPGELLYSESETRSLLSAIATNMWIESESPNTLSGTWFTVQSATLARPKFEILFGDQMQPFVDFCTRMHLLRIERDESIAFNHLKLRDFCALPALFQLAEWGQSDDAPPDDNPLWRIDVTAYPPDFKWSYVTGPIGHAAKDALSLIGWSGMDLVAGYRRVHPEATMSTTAERRRRYVSTPAIAIPDDDPIGVKDTIQIDDIGQVCDIAVYVNVQHTFVGDLQVHLHSPQGLVVVVHDRQGSGGKYLGVRVSVLDPELARLRGTRCEGEWMLEVSDHARGDEGVLESWELDVRIEPGKGNGGE